MSVLKPRPSYENSKPFRLFPREDKAAEPQATESSTEKKKEKVEQKEKERLTYDVGFCDVQHKNKGQDRYIVEPEVGLFGVFDGNGKTANVAKAAARLAHDIYDQEKEPTKFFKTFFEKTQVEASKNDGTDSTAVVVLLEDSGKVYIGSVGDSLVIKYSADTKTLKVISVGTANFGQHPGGFKTPRSTINESVDQLAAGDFLLICSDGLIYSAENSNGINLKDPNVLAVFQDKADSQAKIKKLVEIAGGGTSKQKDDITGIIIEAKKYNSTVDVKEKHQALTKTA